MADRDPEFQRAHLEDLPAGAGRIGALLGGIDLDFVLVSGDCPVCIDDRCRGQQPPIDDAFGAEDDGDLSPRGGGTDGRPGAFEERRVGRRHLLSQPSIAGDEALGEADEACLPDGRLGDGQLGQCDGFLGGGRVTKVGERNSKQVHLALGMSIGFERAALPSQRGGGNGS